MVVRLAPHLPSWAGIERGSGVLPGSPCSTTGPGGFVTAAGASCLPVQRAPPSEAQSGPTALGCALGFSPTDDTGDTSVSVFVRQQTQLWLLTRLPQHLQPTATHLCPLSSNWAPSVATKKGPALIPDRWSKLGDPQAYRSPQTRQPLMTPTQMGNGTTLDPSWTSRPSLWGLVLVPPRSALSYTAVGRLLASNGGVTS